MVYEGKFGIMCGGAQLIFIIILVTGLPRLFTRLDHSPEAFYEEVVPRSSSRGEE